MSETLFDLSKYRSASASSYHADYRDATGNDPAWDKAELYSDSENNAAEPSEDVECNFTQVPTMEEETYEFKYAVVEIVEELSLQEEADRQRLERLVERACSQAGAALRELRDKRLYRNTHKSFEQYCQDRFGYSRISAHYKIAASEVFENLLTKSEQILPTKETQVRPLTKLDPDEQFQVWQQAVEAANGKVPTERIVKTAVLRYKGIVEPVKQKNSSPQQFSLGDVVQVKVLKHSHLHQFNGMWGVVEHVGTFSYTVQISIAKDKQQCVEDELTEVEDEYTGDIKAVGQQIAALIQFELEPIEYAMLEVLQRSKCFTPIQLQLLRCLEENHLAS